MPDWPQEIRAAIARLDLDPAREALLVEELSQHLADRYNELRSEGWRMGRLAGCCGGN